MAKKDPVSLHRKAAFCDYCEKKGWKSPSGRWAVSTIAAAIGKRPAYTSNLLTGYSAIGAVVAREIEQALDLPSGYLDGLADDDFVDVPRIDVRLAAGDGHQPELEEVIGRLKFARSFLRACGVSAASAKVVEVRGPSMEPTIKDGALLLISTSQREPIPGQVFALARPAEGLIVKRLQRRGDQWIAQSDNRDFPDLPVSHGEPITVIGRAVWMGAKL